MRNLTQVRVCPTMDPSDARNEYNEIVVCLVQAMRDLGYTNGQIVTRLDELYETAQDILTQGEL